MASKGPQIVAAGRSVLGSPITAVVAVAVVTAIGIERAEGGIDGSAHIALQMALVERLVFGEELVFTHGPLAFLTTPAQFYGGTAVLGLVFGFAVQLLLVGGVYSLFPATTNRWVRALLTLVVVAPIALDVTNRLVIAVLVLSIAVVMGRIERRPPHTIVVILGLLAGSQALMKFSDGIVVAAMMTVAVWFLPPGRWRSVGTFVAALFASAAVLWFVTGGSFSGVPVYVSTAFEIGTGHATALGTEGRPRYDYLLVVIGVVAFGVLGVGLARRSSSRDRVIGVALISLVWFAYAFKQGFVRHDSGHVKVFFTGIIVVGLALAAPLRWRSGATAVLVGLFAMTLLTQRADLADTYDLSDRSITAVKTWANTLHPGRAEAIRDESRAQLRRQYGLSPEALELVRGETTHIHPTEVGLAWAQPEIEWDPLPNFLAFQVYTTALDRQNVDFLVSDEAPSRILREQGPRSADGRSQLFEAPATTLTIVCHYGELSADDRWQVLGRVEDRCGEPRALGEVRARPGKDITVPSAGPNEIVIAEIHGLDEGVLSSLQTTLWKSPEYRMILDTAEQRSVVRIAPGTAAAGLIVHAPPTVGYDERYTWPSATSIRIAVRRDLASQGPFEVRFSAIPVTRAA